MKSSSFAVHGTFEVSIEGRILHTTVCGPWNIEAVHAYTKALNQQVDTLNGAPWGALATIQGEAIHTTESHQAMVETVRRHRLCGRCATAILMQVNRAPALVKILFAKLYAEAGEHCAFFDDESSALLWLNQQIAGAAKPY